MLPYAPVDHHWRTDRAAKQRIAPRRRSGGSPASRHHVYLGAALARKTRSARPGGRAASSAPARPDPRSVMDARLRCPTAVCPPGRATQVSHRSGVETCSRNLQVSGFDRRPRFRMPCIHENAVLRGGGSAHRQADDSAGLEIGEERCGLCPETSFGISAVHGCTPRLHATLSRFLPLRASARQPGSGVVLSLIFQRESGRRTSA